MATHVQLTDQALVAVRLADALVAQGPAHDPLGAHSNVAHLVVGIAAEPEGLAGRELRRLAGGDPGVRLLSHAGIDAPGLPTVRQAMIALPVAGPPADTQSVLRAAVRAGGVELADVLDDCGLDVAVAGALEIPAVSVDSDALDGAETFGLGTLRGEGFDRDADRVIATVRGIGGGSRTLARMLSVLEEDREALLQLPSVDVDAVVARACEVGSPPIGLSDLATALLGTALESLSASRRFSAP